MRRSSKAAPWCLCLVGGLWLAAGSRLAADGPMLVIHVENYARGAAGDLDASRTEVERIFRAAGVAVSWAGPLLRPVRELAPDGRCRVALVLVNIETPFAGSAEDGDEVLARAAPERSRAWIFVNRVAAFGGEGTVDAAGLLGRVIAHEIGHLLLGSRRHSDRGLLQPAIARRCAGDCAFSREDASTIQRTTIACSGRR